MTAAVALDHPWRVLGPWYRWSTPGDPRAGRASAPVIQKYETSDCVKEFLANPQRCLRYTVEDQVHIAEKISPVPTTIGGRKSRFSDYRYVPQPIRKLFLDTHKRFYLVVCELHCEAPGLPNARSRDACEAGFVMRRRYMSYPDDAAPKAIELMKTLRDTSAKLAKVERAQQRRRALLDRVAVQPPDAAKTVGAMLRGAVSVAAENVGLATRSAFDNVLEEETKTLLALRDEAHHGLLAWRDMAGARWLQQGWIPAPGRQGVGSWELVEDEPQIITESVFPLFPLIPDPRVAKHAGKGRSIYFGLVPTNSSDADATGKARFDSTTLYEIRCFVRRHVPTCPRTGERGDCRGTLFWSASTESFRLAEPFDLAGTANRPVTIQLPDLPALAAQAATARPAPVKMVQPPNSVLKFKVDGGAPKQGGVGTLPQICSFSIPLITIVAWFVLNLFLPVVVIVFNLYFLLALKFCIPPSVSLSAGGQLDLTLKSLEADVAAGIDIDAVSYNGKRGVMRDEMNATFGATLEGSGLGDRLTGSGANDANLSTEVVLGFVRDTTRDRSADAPPPATLEYEVEVPLP